MDILQPDKSADIFSAITYKSMQQDSLANGAISKGIDLYMKKDYKGAVKEFSRGIRLSPTSAYSVDAANYMANAYLKLDDTDNAIEAYKTAIRLDPRNDASHIKLGNFYFAEERYEDAEKEYAEAVKINPTASNYYSLGQAYLNLGRYSEARLQFNRVNSLEPEEPGGLYGLGLAYSKEGRYDKAIQKFDKALLLQNDFLDAELEKGFAYADLGNIERAEKIAEGLEKKDSSLADSLTGYINKVEPPRFQFAWSSSSFSYNSSLNTQVSSLDSYLEAAGTSKTFTMEFLFNKAMDRSSVENRLKWNIQRSTINKPAHTYNFGQEIPATEVEISLYPDNVYYDEDKQTAVVTFTIQQNSDADATIDPSHIEFRFSGLDKEGLEMDPKGDQFMGFSGVI